MDVVYSGHIENDFEGFDENKVFKMDDGSFWIQSEYNYDYMYEYNPEAAILESDGDFYLFVCGKTVKVEQLDEVIESRIDGEFNGWDDNKAYKLENGEIWKQSSYHYEYAYAYCPDVLIYYHDGNYYMQVEGTISEVERL